MARNLRPGPNCILGTVIERNGPLSNLVQVTGGQVWKCHVDMLCEVGDTPLEEPVGSNNQTNPLEDVIFPPIISTESEPGRPVTDSQNQPVPQDQQVPMKGPMNILQLLLDST